MNRVSVTCKVFPMSQCCRFDNARLTHGTPGFPGNDFTPGHNIGRQPRSNFSLHHHGHVALLIKAIESFVAPSVEAKWQASG